MTDHRPDPAELRRLRRQAAKRLHPDVGGDPAEFAAAMQALARLAAPAAPLGRATPAPARLVVVHARPVTRALRTARTTSGRLVRGVRENLPRSFPGSRRYGHL